MRPDEPSITDEAEDRFIDAMLCEALGTTAPPDQSAAILAQLAELSKSSVSESSRRRRSSSRRFITWLPIVLAAVLLLAVGRIFWTSSRNVPAGGVVPAEVAKNQDDHTFPDTTPLPREDPPTAPQTELAAGTGLVQPDTTKNRGKREFAMGLDELPFGPAEEVTQGPATPATPDRVAANETQPLDGDEIVRRLDTLLEAGWEEMNIAPQQQAAAEEIASRLASIVAGRDRIAAPDAEAAKRLVSGKFDAATLSYIRDQKTASNLGGRWARYLIGESAWSRLNVAQRAEIVAVASAAFDGRDSYDSIAERFLVAEGSATPGDAAYNSDAIWMAGLAGERSVPLTNQFCDVMLDLDVTCARCHGHPLERDIAQADYWGLNAVFQTSLRWQRDPEGHLRIARRLERNPSSDVVFYDAPDHRQMVASPSVALRWIDSGMVGKSPAGLSEIASELAEGDRFARATVNGLWKLVYGNRLVGRTSDPTSPPMNESFVAARDLLADQLRAHNYDLGVATAWIVAARPMQLATAIDHFNAESLIVSDDHLMAAELQQRAFAAFASPIRDWSFDELVAVAGKFNGADGNRSLLAPGVLLAQTAADPSGKPRTRKSQKQLRDEALLRSLAGGAATDESPAGWLQSIAGQGGFREQARHLFYVAGFDAPSESQIESAIKIRKSVVSDEVALQQLWWAIRLSKGSP